MGAGHVGGDRQAQTHPPAPVLVPSRVEPRERPDRLVPPFGGDAGAVILDRDAEAARADRRLDLGPRAVADGVPEQVFQRAADPQLSYRTVDDYMAAGKRIQEPIREHLSRFTSPEQRQFFLEATQRVWPEGSRASAGPDDLQILVPAFLISELKRAFEIGFLLYLPFIVIDLVVTTILMAMGMSMVSPTVISIPFKLFLFIAIDGWSRLMHGLVLSYAIPS